MTRIDPVERHLFFEGILLRYGYDFRQYAEASLDRRLAALMSRSGGASLLDLLKSLLGDPEKFRSVLGALTINTTEFFRDPSFFRALRESIFPILKTYPKITLWSAGCSTGEEVLSLAIALEEEGLLRRTTIHATDISPTVLRAAKDGIYDSSCISLFNKSYSAAGCTGIPSNYYTAEYGLVRFKPDLLQNVVFSEHNLATDSVFVEAHLILCRNVLIYFSRDLQNRAIDLFSRSLIYKGFLGIGPKESLRFSTSGAKFVPLETGQNLYTVNPHVQLNL